MRTTPPSEKYCAQQLERNLVFFIQPKVMFCYDFNAALHVVLQIYGAHLSNFRLILTNITVCLNIG